MTIRSGIHGKTGTLRLRGKELEALRRAVFERDCWKCKECGVSCGWVTGHLAHIQSRGAGGSDTESNTRLLCAKCHSREHNAGGKPVPAKVKFDQ